MIIKGKGYGVILFLLLSLPSCFFKNEDKESSNKYTLLIQLISEDITLASIINKLTPLVNTIIKEELGLDKDYDFSFFIPKEHQRLTVYYLDNIQKNGESLILSELEQLIINTSVPSHISLATEVNFFGDQQDELVIMVNDPQGELVLLNQELKQLAHTKNKLYKQTKHIDLYDITQSERYSFVPHMGLGRMRSGSIKQHINNNDHIKIFERIRQRIIASAIKIIKDTTMIENTNLVFKKLGVLDLQNRTYIKEYNLG